MSSLTDPPTSSSSSSSLTPQHSQFQPQPPMQQHPQHYSSDVPPPPQPVESSSSGAAAETWLAKYQVDVPRGVSHVVSDYLPLPDGFEPRKHDVVCGRGRGYYNCAGNVRFRTVVKQHVDLYTQQTTKPQKTAVLELIAKQVQQNNGNGESKFVKQLPNGTWCELGDVATREKVGNAMREALSARNTAKVTTNLLRNLFRSNKNNKNNKNHEEDRAAAATQQPQPPQSVQPNTNSSSQRGLVGSASSSFKNLFAGNNNNNKKRSRKNSAARSSTNVTADACPSDLSSSSWSSRSWRPRSWRGSQPQRVPAQARRQASEPRLTSSGHEPHPPQHPQVHANGVQSQRNVLTPSTTSTVDPLDQDVEMMDVARPLPALSSSNTTTNTNTTTTSCQVFGQHVASVVVDHSQDHSLALSSQAAGSSWMAMETDSTSSFFVKAARIHSPHHPHSTTTTDRGRYSSSS